MKKLFNIFIVFLLSFVLAGVEGEVFAADCKDILEVTTFDVKKTYVEQHPDNSFTITIKSLPASTSYTLKLLGINGPGKELITSTDTAGILTFNSTSDIFEKQNKYSMTLEGPTIENSCFFLEFSIEEDGYQCSNISIWQETSEGDLCTYNSNNCLAAADDDTNLINKKIHIKSTITSKSTGKPVSNLKIIHNIEGFGRKISATTNSDGIAETIHEALNVEKYNLKIQEDNAPDTVICSHTDMFQVKSTCECKNPGSDNPNDPNTPPTYTPDKPFSLCNQIPSQYTQEKAECISCTEGSEGAEENQGVWTAIGCIKRDAGSIMEKLITVGLGISGGVALLTFLAAGFIYSTSQGDPKAYGKAKEMMTASIVGILFVIFSVTILQFIGYEILKIPGFGGL